MPFILNKKRKELMRCPKCGYISFDNMETCLKCGKDISAATSAFQGSTLNVENPSFLKFEASEETEIEGAAEVDGDIEFADPDLEILVDDDDDDGIDFTMEEDEGDTDDDDLALAEEFGEIESFADDEDDDEELDLSADLGQFEDVPEEDSFSFEDDSVEEVAAEEAMDFPDELADISDLSHPGAGAVSEAEPEAAMESPAPDPAEPEDDLDFSSLDMDLDLDEAEEEELAAVEDSGAEDKKRTSMDEELNFDLDLGGLSIHDDLK